MKNVLKARAQCRSTGCRVCRVNVHGQETIFAACPGRGRGRVPSCIRSCIREASCALGAEEKTDRLGAQTTPHMTRSLSTALDSLEDWWQSSQAITQEPRNGLLAHSQASSYSNRGWLSPPAPPRLHPAVLEAERGAAAVARDADGGSVLAKLRAENLALRERLRGAQAPGGAAEPNGVSKPSPPLKDPTIALSVVFEEASRRAAEPRSDYRSTQHAAELAATTAAAARARARELAANKAASEAQLQEAAVYEWATTY